MDTRSSGASIAIFDELKQGVQDIEFLTDPTAGEVRIAAPIGTGTGFVAAVIDRLARRYPRVVCHLTVCEFAAERSSLSSAKWTWWWHRCHAACGG